MKSRTTTRILSLFLATALFGANAETAGTSAVKHQVRRTRAAINAGIVLAGTRPGSTFDPLTIPKDVDPLSIPGVMPKTPNPGLTAQGIEYYEIAVRQFQQQRLPTGSPATTVWVTVPSTSRTRSTTPLTRSEPQPTG